MQAYDYHQGALLRLLKALFTLAGIVEGGAPVATLPRLKRNAIQRVLLPIESCLRRIIFYRAERMKMPQAAEKEDNRSEREKRRAANRRKNRRDDRRGRGPVRRLRAAVFWLFDKKIYQPHEADPHKRPPRGGSGPRISCFDGSDPPREPVVEKPKRDPNCALKLCRRMQAVMGALKDIDAQALRLKRLMEKRKADPKQKQPTPIRKGPPPGYRPEQTNEVDVLLYECDFMARETPPPTE